MGSALAKILQPLLVPIIARVISDWLQRYARDPEFRAKVDAVRAEILSAKTDQETMNASTKVQRLLAE